MELKNLLGRNMKKLKKLLTNHLKNKKSKSKLKSQFWSRKKLKRLIIPYKFKYIKSEITLEISVVKDEETQINSPSFLESE